MTIDVTTVAAEAIQNTATLVEMHQSQWRPSKTKPAVAQELQKQKGATGKSTTVRVNLANGFEAELRPITRILSRAYHTHMRMSVAWREGERMLPNVQLVDYLGEMQGYKTELDKAKAALEPKLPALIQNAIAKNAQLGDIADYPTPADIIAQFGFTFDFTPMPAASAFGSLPEGFGELFADKYNERVANNMAEGIQDLIDRIYAQTGQFNIQLNADKPKFYQSTIDNLAQLGTTLQSMNMTGDTTIEAIVKAVSMATSYSAEQLKANMNARTAAAASCAAMLGLVHAEVAEEPDSVSETPPEPDSEQPAESNGDLDSLLGPSEPETVVDVEEPVSTVETPEEQPAEPAPETPDQPTNGDDEVADLFSIF